MVTLNFGEPLPHVTYEDTVGASHLECHVLFEWPLCVCVLMCVHGCKIVRGIVLQSMQTQTPFYVKTTVLNTITIYFVL